MKKGFVFLVFVLVVGIVSGACAPENLVMRLSGETNAHAAVWDYDGTGYDVEVCSAVPVRRECADNNPLWLSGGSNSHVSLLSSDEFATPVCVSGVGSSCRKVIVGVSDPCEGVGESVLFSMSREDNSHVDISGDSAYGVQICCEGVVELGSGVFWTDMNGFEISVADFGDSVQMVLTDSDVGVFDIREKDCLGVACFNYPIRDDIEGVSEFGDLVGVWEITRDDLDLTPGDYEDFVFLIEDFESESLEVVDDEDDDVMSVEILSPSTTSYFEKGTEVNIKVRASDADDEIFGEVLIDGVAVEDFGNGGIDFDYPFDVNGTFSIVASATNSRGEVASDAVNIMIYDLSVDGVYVAACIDWPKDAIDIDDSTVNFIASCTLGIEVADGEVSEIWPVDFPGRFSWYWEFSALLSDGSRVTREIVGSSEGYNFVTEFPSAGDNWATLRVEFD